MTNELKPYEYYRETTLQWLDKVPSHWDIIRNKNVLDLKKEVVGNQHAKYTLLSLTLNGIIARDMENAKGKFPSDFSTYQTVDINDLVFCLFDIDETPRTVGLSSMEGMITGAYTVFSVKNANPLYLYYYNLFLDQNKLLKPLYTGLRKVISTDTFLRTKIPLPPREEQDKIVRYLDLQLAKINKFIKAKRKLITVLKEKKQAIIHGAVTKGLNSSVKMKPSDIVWVGEIPEHWEITRNKNLLELRNEIVGEEHKKYTLLSLTTNGIIPRDMENAKGKFPSDFSSYQKVQKDDLVFCLFDIDETPRTVGLSSLDGMITGAYTVFKATNTTKEYLYYYYLSLDQKKALKPLYTGLRKVIPTDAFLRAKVPLPPKEEQREIVSYIENSISTIDNTIYITQREIELIAEYRTSLISEVVTGKVDVRNIENDYVIEEDILDTNEEMLEVEKVLEG
ncbi:restriction endonuclease subunit S, partial [Bacillus vallismortis]